MTVRKIQRNKPREGFNVNLSLGDISAFYPPVGWRVGQAISAAGFWTLLAAKKSM